MAHEPRLRDYLTRDEVAALLRAAKKSPRYGARNHAMILLAYRHGLRASELVNLRVSDLDLASGTIYCRRRQRLALEPASDEAGRGRGAGEGAARARAAGDDYVFRPSAPAKMSRSAFWRIVSKAGARAGLPVKTYAHLLRHSCGYFLANKGCDLRLIQDYLGHKQIQNTVGIRRSTRPIRGVVVEISGAKNDHGSPILAGVGIVLVPLHRELRARILVVALTISVTTGGAQLVPPPVN